MMTEMKIGVFGYGVVGKAQSLALTSRNWAHKIHDPRLEHFISVRDGKFQDINVAFICVSAPTLNDGKVDGTEVVRTLEGLCDGATAIIRSTLLPGSTEMLAKMFPNLDLFFIPEFLSERTSNYDAVHPKRTIIGYSDKVGAKLKSFFEGGAYPSFVVNPTRLLPPTRDTLWLPAWDAEGAKYAANTFYALKVAYMNQMSDAMVAMGCSWDNVHSAILADAWTGPVHTVIELDGFRGYGGNCLPKDVKAFCHAAIEAGAKMTILEAADAYNYDLVASQPKKA